MIKKKGGDIDLLIVTNEAGVKIFDSKNLDILVDLKKHSEIGMSRIDLRAVTEEDLRTQPFYIKISSEMVRI
jgi:hypothetical protein